jgi:hypothetical protein
MRLLITPSAIRLMATRAEPIGEDLPRSSAEQPIGEEAQIRVGRSLAARLHLWRRERGFEDALAGGEEISRHRENAREPLGFGIGPTAGSGRVS